MREYDEGYYDLHGSSQQFDDQPVVLLSTERSGSNLLRSILDAHSEITAPHPLETAYPWRNLADPGELDPAQRRRLVRDVLINKDCSHEPIVAPVPVDEVHDRVERATAKSFLTVQEALYATYAAIDDASTWVTKDPSVWGYLEELRDYYDGLKIVYLVRDARDVVLSFQRSNVGRYHPYFNAARWREEQAAGRELLEDEAGADVHLVRYRDLLRQPEAVAEAVCSFLEVPYEPEMLYYYESDHARAAADSAQAFENLSVPIKRDNYAKYVDGLDDEAVRITEAVAADELDYFGFDRVTGDDELSSVDLDPRAYEREDAERARRARRRHWRENPTEQLSRFASASFDRYMVLRYGLLS